MVRRGVGSEDQQEAVLRAPPTLSLLRLGPHVHGILEVGEVR